jgi:pimeloyl-ACP methyl ester carboxylesterase
LGAGDLAPQADPVSGQSLLVEDDDPFDVRGRAEEGGGRAAAGDGDPGARDLPRDLRITPEDMTQSPMRLEVMNRTFFAVLESVTRFWPSLRFPGFAISPRRLSREEPRMDDIQHLVRRDGESLAWRRVDGEGPTVIWIGGFRSDMEGTKALALDAAARARGWDYVRYDHFAHGRSSGDWREATIGRWREDAIALIDSLEGPVVPVGSSMGGWVALLLALARPERMSGLVLVNPAQDFTERLMWPGLADHERQTILRDGETLIVEEGLGEYVLTLKMFEEARNWLLLGAPLPIKAPIHIIQGRARTRSCPGGTQIELAERLTGAATCTLDLDRADGDHRLSAPADLDRLVEAVERNRAASAAFTQGPHRKGASVMRALTILAAPAALLGLALSACSTSSTGPRPLRHRPAAA